MLDAFFLKDQSPYKHSKNYQLYLMDSLEFLNQVEDQSVDLIFADPPYNLSNDGFTVHSGKRVSVNKADWDRSQGAADDFEFHNAWIQACKRILKPDGSIWISGTYHSIYQCGYALQNNGYKILNEIAWYKPNAAPNISCRYFTASHETLIWARACQKAKHTFNYQAVKNGHWHERDKLKNPGKQMRSVWSIPTPSKDEKIYGKHPTQKPLELLKRIITAASNEEDIILDPFAGSSTTGVAALELNRNYIGIDNCQEYLDLSVQRLQDVTTQISLAI